MPHFDLLKIINEQVINPDSHRHYLALYEERVAFPFYNHQLFVVFRNYFNVVEELLSDSWVLFEGDEVWIGVPGFFEEVVEYFGIFSVHPMLALLENIAVLSCKTSKSLFQCIHFSDIFLRFIIAIVRVIHSSNLNGKSDVPNIENLNSVGVSSHHGCSC